MGNLKELALKAFEAVFENRGSVNVDGLVYLMEETPRTRLRFVRIGEYTFLEQNPEKRSHWGKLAREGHRILWVLKGPRYIAQVRDGVFHDLREKNK